jgi:PAS domain S-box-containing protein
VTRARRQLLSVLVPACLAALSAIVAIALGLRTREAFDRADLDGITRVMEVARVRTRLDEAEIARGALEGQSIDPRVSAAFYAPLEEALVTARRTSPDDVSAAAIDDARARIASWEAEPRATARVEAIRDARASLARAAEVTVGRHRAALDWGRRGSGRAIAIATALLAALAVAIAMLERRREDRDDARLVALPAVAAAPPLKADEGRLGELTRERDRLRRRLELVSATNDAEGLIELGRRIVATIAAEAHAAIVLLHVAPTAEPLAAEVIAAVGASSVGASSPPAVREVLASGERAELQLSPDDTRLAVRSSTATVVPGYVVLAPVRAGDRIIGVVEIGSVRPLGDAELDAVDEILAMAGPGIAHVLANDYAHRLSSEVRAHAATVADVYLELDTVFEALADGLAVTDAEGNIVRVNAAGRELLGVADLDDESSRQTLADATNPLLQALREGSEASGLEVALSAAGERRIVQVKLSTLTRDPNSKAAVAVFRDVTRERQLERDLRAQSRELATHVGELEHKQAELERATRLKSEFLANMSHELRTPLNAVIGFAEVLLDGTYGGLNDKQADCTRDVLAGGRHLLALINDVLDLSKIEAGKMELQREDFDLAGAVTQTLTLVRPQVQTKSIQLACTVAAGKFWVHADPDRVRQVVVNLLSNAVKFTPVQGRVTVEAEALEDGGTRVSVTDTGIGIAAEDFPKIFGEFSQVDGSITRRFGGTGLGLAISKRLVEMNGGVIGFSSEVGKGSKFFFTLPAAARAERPAFGMPQVPKRSASILPSIVPVLVRDRVLVLDADAAAGRLAVGALAEAGFEGVQASNLAKARELARPLGFRAAVLDPDMPGATRAEVLRLVQIELGLPLVVTSAHAESELGLPLRGVGCLRKPLDRTALVDQLRAAIARVGGAQGALVVDPDEADAGAVRGLLEREGYQVEIVADAAAALASLLVRKPRVIVQEIDLVDDGEALLRELQRRNVAPVIVLTARELDRDELSRVEQLAALVVRKGTLSRSAFAHQVATVTRDGSTQRRRVLAVDDNEQNLRLIGAVLVRRGYEVMEARDAASAVAIARAERPDAILMDVMLPDVDGLTATRELKSDPATRGIPVVAVTAQAMAGDEEKARDAGCCDYVTKPIDPSRLFAALDRALAA